MRTTINIEDNIIDEIVKLYNAKTKTSAINQALKDLVLALKKQKLINLRGKIDIVDNLDELKKIELFKAGSYE
ncbi:MAG: type II toxin-antitoxin system VapB family antitoxin [Candidatus Kapabacteria bacterium]|nr:type II toxin-antitoxin system VapB family antitoxin [Candidatus Kapabacteria bacterium]